MNKWKEIWEKKGKNLVLPEADITETLFKSGGYDSKCARTTLDDWDYFIRSIVRNCEISQATTVYEVGCGAGAVLHSLQQIAYKVGGIDYCEDFIKQAKTIIKSEDLTACEAIDMSVEPKYDVILNGGCFIYFPSKEYTETVLDKMLSKANRMVALFDINDEEKREEAEGIRRAAVGENYDKMYEGLNHLYWKKEYFLEYAAKKKVKCEIGPQPMKNYPNGHYRYSVYLTKI